MAVLANKEGIVAANGWISGLMNTIQPAAIAYGVHAAMNITVRHQYFVWAKFETEMTVRNEHAYLCKTS
jgi:hypothetical protein